MPFPRSSLLLVLLACAAPAQAQWRPVSPVPREPPAAVHTSQANPSPQFASALDPVPPRPYYAYMVAGGVVGGFLGALAVGANFGAENSIGDAILGSAIGAVAGAPVGVHLGNAARGNPLLTIGAGVGAGAVALSMFVGESDYRIFLPVSGAVAILAAVAAEAHAMPR